MGKYMLSSFVLIISVTRYNQPDLMYSIASVIGRDYNFINQMFFSLFLLFFSGNNDDVGI